MRACTHTRSVGEWTLQDLKFLLPPDSGEAVAAFGFFGFGFLAFGLFGFGFWALGFFGCGFLAFGFFGFGFLAANLAFGFFGFELRSKSFDVC